MILNSQNISKILLVNKPIDWTSFDVVKKVRGIIRKKYDLKKIKVGHAGTLDPKASGLLILCTGTQTKQMKLFECLNKKYIGTLKIGCVTDSFDSETKEYNSQSYEHLSIEEIKRVFLDFIGHQEQKPPIFSAVKVNGERLYKKARRGEIDFEVKSRKIVIHKLTLIEINFPFIKFEVECSKGTYIRSLVNDIGKKLLCGAYLYELTRTSIGDFTLEKAIEIHEIFESI
jgi:tRNA pseudouridine55 synthase